MTGWFLTQPGTGQHPARIFCFPHAGGNAGNFLAWQPSLASDAQVIAVLPRHARGGRLSLGDYIDGATLAIAQAAGEDTRPIYLFGHSLGALVAFEVSRRLREEPALAHLIVSALAAPALLPSARVLELSRKEGQEFADALAFFGGMPAEVLADKELLEVLLPGIKADFELAAQYRYQPGAPLQIGVTVVTGSADNHIEPDHVEAWRAECARPPAIHWVPGGHFYFEDDPDLIIDVLRDVVRADQHVELI
jgi:surfactin synthase thioesterase subunit